MCPVDFLSNVHTCFHKSWASYRCKVWSVFSVLFSRRRYWFLHWFLIACLLRVMSKGFQETPSARSKHPLGTSLATKIIDENQVFVERVLRSGAVLGIWPGMRKSCIQGQFLNQWKSCFRRENHAFWGSSGHLARDAEILHSGTVSQKIHENHIFVEENHAFWGSSGHLARDAEILHSGPVSKSMKIMLS